MAQRGPSYGSSLSDLPGDIISLILRKLAVLDPCSLLPATCAFKAFRQQVIENPGIWKTAFFGGVSVCQDHRREEQIEAVVVSLGGYERLVKARTWGECPERFGLCEQTRRCWLMLRGGSASKLPKDNLPVLSPEVTKHLVVFRSRGRLAFWGLLPSYTKGPKYLQTTGDFKMVRGSATGSEAASSHISLVLSASRFEPGFCSGLEAVKVTDPGQAKFYGSRRTVKGPVSMEIHVVSDRTARPRPFGLPVTGASTWAWKCKVLFGESSFPAYSLSGIFLFLRPQKDENTPESSAALMHHLVIGRRIAQQLKAFWNLRTARALRSKFWPQRSRKDSSRN